MLAVVGGTRPNAVKLAPILRELRRRDLPHYFIWTGQHKGALDICEELGMPPPDVRLSLGGVEPAGYLETITSQLTAYFAHRTRAEEPETKAVVVVGDVTSTLAATLAAAAHEIPVVHVEAGLRSGDWAMPEERNRILVDRLSDLLLCSERQAEARLGRHPDRSVRFVGNVMIDSLKWAIDEIAKREAEAPFQILEFVRTGTISMDEAKQIAKMPPPPKRRYALVTTHRPSNVDTPEAWLRTQLAVKAVVDQGLEVAWVRHPRWTHWRTIHDGPLAGCPFVSLISPAPYVRMIAMMKDATLVATDSGGIQEETTSIGVPCLTLRENTERPVTVEQGTNVLVGLDPKAIGRAVQSVLDGSFKRGGIPEGWDGRAAERIVDAVAGRYL